MAIQDDPNAPYTPGLGPPGFGRSFAMQGDPNASAIKTQHVAQMVGGGDAQSPSGLPTPGMIGATAPQPLQAFGGIPSVTPTYADPNQNDAYMRQYQQLMQQSLQPGFDQQRQQLEADLRARGIQQSGAAGELETELLTNQGATLAGAYAPIVSQGYGYTQADTRANQDYANAATGLNANYYNEALTGNANAYNEYLARLYGSGEGLANTELAAYLNSYGPNTGVQSIMNTGLAGTQSAYGNVYGQTIAGQDAALSSLGTAAGYAYGGGKGH